MSVLKYDPDSEQILQCHYQLSSDSLAGEHCKNLILESLTASGLFVITWVNIVKT